MTQISTEIVTHKLKIKWEWTKYITRKVAESIFSQLTDSWNTISIVNPQTLTYIQKYKSEVELSPLDNETQTLEETLATHWLTESQKEEVRNLIKIRKEEYKTTSNWVLENIIKSIKKV